MLTTIFKLWGGELMATCFLKQKTSAFTWERYENFTEGLTPRQEPGIEQADQPENLSVARKYLAATHVGNYALFGGGKGDGYIDNVDVYTTLEKITRITLPPNVSYNFGSLSGATTQPTEISPDYPLYGTVTVS